MSAASTHAARLAHWGVLARLTEACMSGDPSTSGSSFPEEARGKGEEAEDEKVGKMKRWEAAGGNGR